MQILRYLILGVFAPLCLPATAQQSFEITLPDAHIFADRLRRGDGDTYGLGDWHCTFSVSLSGTEIVVDGQIVFSEKANDFTTITGAYHRRIEVGELSRCRHCWVTLEGEKGSVGGPNIGARGYRWFAGQGLIRRARIQTDTFGDDVGRIGGTVQFAPIKVRVDCAIAGGLIQLVRLGD